MGRGGSSSKAGLYVSLGEQDAVDGSDALYIVLGDGKVGDSGNGGRERVSRWEGRVV